MSQDVSVGNSTSIENSISNRNSEKNSELLIAKIPSAQDIASTPGPSYYDHKSETIPRKKIPKKKYKKRAITKCEHTDLVHYAKGMCNHCYHTKGRGDLATECIHLDRPAYAKKMCRNCYINDYRKLKANPASKKIKKIEKHDATKLDISI